MIAGYLAVRKKIGAISAEAWAVIAGYPAVRKKIEAISAYTGSIAAVLLHEESRKLVFGGRALKRDFFRGKGQIIHHKIPEALQKEE